MDIFGGQTTQVGPVPQSRVMREQLPGVRGYRLYQLVGPGADTLTWTVQGRIVARTFRGLILFLTGVMDNDVGRIAKFVDNSGEAFDACELVDYRPVPPFQRCKIGGVDYMTCLVQGTIQRAGG